MAMKLACALFLSLVVRTPAPPGKSTISSSNAMTSLAFNLKYLPVTVAEDNGVGNERYNSQVKQNAIEGRVQVLVNTSYTAKNCQLYSAKGQLGSDSSYQSMIANGLGKACTYSTGKKYSAGTKLHMVFANNDVQCCNACVATGACVAATFQTSSQDHSGGMGPQTWEGFGMHITDVTTSKTTGGITVSQLESDFKARLGNHSTFDQFMDYSVTHFTYDLQPYVDAFKADGVSHFLGQWQHGDETWYSLIFLVEGSHYVIELVSTIKPNVAASYPQMEQRMSDAHCDKFKLYKSHPANVLLISSINRATSDMDKIDNVYTNAFKGKSTHKIDGKDVVRHCFSFMGVSGLEFPPGPSSTPLDEDVCFTSRTADSKKDEILSVKGFEEMMWAEHAATLGSNADSMIDKYSDNHYALSIPASGLTELKKEFTANDPYPITKDTRLAYACKQNYIIDPTGWCIQPIRASPNWPKCTSGGNSDSSATGKGVMELMV